MKSVFLNAALIAVMLFQSLLYVPATMNPVQAQNASSGTSTQAAAEPVINRGKETGMVTFIGSADGAAMPVQSPQMGVQQAGDRPCGSRRADL